MLDDSSGFKKQKQNTSFVMRANCKIGQCVMEHASSLCLPKNKPTNNNSWQEYLMDIQKKGRNSYLNREAALASTNTFFISLPLMRPTGLWDIDIFLSPKALP